MLTKNGSILLAALLLSLPVAAPGCTPREDRSPFADQESDDLLAVVIDLSGSFGQYLQGDDAIAWRFFLRMTEKFQNERAGARTRIVLSQLSGKPGAVLWDGNPRQLRSQFGTATAFREFLRTRADPSGSRVHDAVAETVEYVATRPGVRSGKTRSAVIVLSDMDDTTPDREGSRRRLLECLKRYGKSGVVGLYWVDVPLAPRWQRDLEACGLRHALVVPGVVADPPLPSFED